MDFSFLDGLNVTAYVIDAQFNLIYINQTAARRYNNADELIGQNVLTCHKKEKSRQRLMEIVNEFALGRREPYNYSLKKGSKVMHKVILPYYQQDTFKGLIEFMYFE